MKTTTLLPSIRSRVGDWNYYVTTLSFEEVSSLIKAPDEIHERKKLAEWIQREAIDSHAEAIAQYIVGNSQRFLGSLIVGVYGGSPNWTPLNVKVPADEGISEEQLERIEGRLGLLRLSGAENLFAIDGQHRVAGIKLALKNETVAKQTCDDSVSAIFVAHDPASEPGKQRTRRLFTTVNKKARTISKAAKIALDEDDGFAIVTRRLIDSHVLFEDAGKHAAMAALAGTYLAYCDCVRKGTGEKVQLVAAFTNGDSDNLMVGRNGIFYDRKGRDWDATITRIVDNPISIRQAFWAPYKKCIRMIEEQVAKRASAAGDAANARMQAAVATGQPPPPPPPPKKVDPGMLAALGLVLSTLLVALGGIFAAFTKLPLWQMPLAIAAILLAVSIPSMIIAWLKLRKRNLGPILDANGWAVNAKARINVPFGASLTKVAALPPGAQSDLVDPFAEKKKPWGLYGAVLVTLLLAGAWYLGKLDTILPGNMKSTTVLGTNAPAYPLPSAGPNAVSVEPTKQ